MLALDQQRTSPAGDVRFHGGRAFLILMTFSLFAGACSPTEPDRLSEIDRNRAIWEVARPQAYSFVHRTACYCGEPANRFLRTTVEGNDIVRVESVPGEHDDDPNPEELDLAWGRTIDELFDWLVTLADGNPAVLDMRWDPVWGIPIEVIYDGALNIIDDEIQFTSTDFTPMG